MFFRKAAGPRQWFLWNICGGRATAALCRRIPQRATCRIALLHVGTFCIFSIIGWHSHENSNPWSDDLPITCITSKKPFFIQYLAKLANEGRKNKECWKAVKNRYSFSIWRRFQCEKIYNFFGLLILYLVRFKTLCVQLIFYEFINVLIVFASVYQ